jgi:hypothetical protein
MDKTLSEVCVKDSITKFFVDSLVTTEKLTVLFDEDIDSPEAYPDKYVSIRFGQLQTLTPAFQMMTINIVTAKDPEGFILSATRDQVMAYLTDETTGMRRIPFYNTSVSPWVQIGAFMVTDVVESIPMDGPNQTKIKNILTKLSFMTKI